MDRDVLPLLISLIDKGDAPEKECAANTLWIIAKTSKGKAEIIETSNAMEELTRLSKSDNQAIQEAAKRVLLELKETRITPGIDLFIHAAVLEYVDLQEIIVIITIISLGKYLSSIFTLHSLYLNRSSQGQRNIVWVT